MKTGLCLRQFTNYFPEKENRVLRRDLSSKTIHIVHEKNGTSVRKCIFFKTIKAQLPEWLPLANYIVICYVLIPP